MRARVAIYDFYDLEEARLARDALDDAGFQAWLEEGEPFGDGTPRHRLLVPVEDADRARSALTEPLPELPEDDLPAPGRRSIWVPAVAALVLVGVVVASVDAFLWPWILFAGLVGFLVWRSVGPRRP